MFDLPLVQPRLRIGLLSPHNPYDMMSFSGTAAFAAQALANRPEIDFRILGHRPPTPSTRFIDKWLRRRAPAVDLETLDFDGLDAVIGIVASDLLDALAHTRPELPFLHVTDATPAYLRDVYGWAVPATADETEARVATRAAFTVYSSNAVADRAATDLSLSHLHTRVIPFGINLDVDAVVPPRKPSLDRFEMLFVGLDWVRKGGDIAVETLNLMRARGYDAHLTIVGQCPETYRSHPNITYVGFLNKNRAGDRRRLAALYARSHVFLLPSRGDCTPMVIGEAMAWGTPVLATDVGGIAEMIGGKGAGRVLPLYSSPEAWAHSLDEIITTPGAYNLMCDAAFDRAHLALSWDNWASNIVDLLEETRSTQHRASAA